MMFYVKNSRASQLVNFYVERFANIAASASALAFIFVFIYV